MLHPRKAFTLLELMVAFIIMAILSAIAVPSLLGVVKGDQTTADLTSADGIADAAYYGAQSGTGTFPVSAADVDAHLAGSPLSDANISVVTYDGSNSAYDGDSALKFQFPDGTTVYLSDPQSAADGSPVVIETDSGSGSSGSSSSSEVAGITVSPSTIEDNGIATGTVTVTDLDSQGNPISGVSVALNTSNGMSDTGQYPGSFSDMWHSYSITDSSGQATFSVTDANDESDSITAFNATTNAALPGSATATFAPSGPTSSSATALTVIGGTTISSGGTAYVESLLVDADNGSIAGDSAELIPESGSAVVTPILTAWPNVYSSSPDGLVQFSVTDSVAETVVFQLKDTTANVTLDQTVSITFQ